MMSEKIVEIKRVSKVVKGGRLFAFTALSVVGDGKGRVGFGLAKGQEVQVAVQKSLDVAKRNVISVPLKESTIQYPIEASSGASKIFLKPAIPGTGIIAGGAMRAVLELVGVRDVLTKIYGSTNAMNVVRATFKALESMVSKKDVLIRRGKLEGVSDRQLQQEQLKRERRQREERADVGPGKQGGADKLGVSGGSDTGKTKVQSKAEKKIKSLKERAKKMRTGKKPAGRKK